jgi:cell division septum initiation protein DivIVA
MDLDYLIDRLEELLDHSTRVPGTSWVVINEDEFLRLIDQMRISVPQEIKSARQIEGERDALLAAAQEQAEAMIGAAREKAGQLVNEHSVLSQAEERSEEILGVAYQEAAVIRSDADSYAFEVLERIAEQLEGFRRTIENGMHLLKEGDVPHEVPDDASSDTSIQPEIVGDEPPSRPG